MGCLWLEQICCTFVWVACTMHVLYVNADRSLTVTNTSCGGNIDLDVPAQMLHLNYYGDEIGNPEKSSWVYSNDKTCLYTISTSNVHVYESEICILLKLKKHQDPWDLGCMKTFKIFIGKYHGANMPSYYTCSDLEPLCTTERNVYVLFTSEYHRVLEVMGITVSVELDIYLRKKKVTTTQRITTMKSQVTDDSEESFNLSTVWIAVICVVSVGFCACCVYCCCCRESDAQSQNANYQPENIRHESVGMCVRSVDQLQSENPPDASMDPPDYYSVCRDEAIPENQKLAGFQPYCPQETCIEEHSVIPSAPPPPYQDVQGYSPYSGTE